MNDWLERLEHIRDRLIASTDELLSLAKGEGGRCITVNAEIGLTLLRMPREDFDLLTGRRTYFTVDGVGFGLLLEQVFGMRPAHVRGATLCQQLLRGGDSPPTAICVIGGTDAARQVLARRFQGNPKVRLLGGRFSAGGEPEDPAFVGEYLKQKAAIDLLALQLKGEWLSLRLEPYDPRRLRVQVGGGIEFAAGVLPRAPVWMQRAGLEWLFRLAVQPSRLRRTAKSVVLMGLLVLALACRQRWLAPRLIGWYSLSESGRAPADLRIAAAPARAA